MKIGMTFDVRSWYLQNGFGEEETAEFDRDDTIESIAKAITECGHLVDKIGNIRQLLPRLAAGEKWDLVFNIAEGISGFGRESQVPGLLEAYAIPYTFSDPLVLSLTLHKELTKRIVRSYGIPTTDSALVSTENEIDTVSMPFPLFLKPVAEGTSKGIKPNSLVHNRQELQRSARELLDQFKQPVLIEPFLPGREFTVGIIGTGKTAEALGCLEVIPLKNAEMNAASYWNKENCEQVIDYDAPRDQLALQCEKIALTAWRVLGCRDCGRVDLRADERGTPYFLEVNPLAGLHPEHSDLPILCNKIGISYQELIKKILDAACKRLNLK